MIGKEKLSIEKQSSIEGSLFIIVPKDEIVKTKTIFKVNVLAGEEKLETVKTHFTGPIVRRKK